MALVRKRFTFGPATVECYVFVVRRGGGVNGTAEEFWFKSREIAEFMEYKNPAHAVTNMVTAKHRTEWSALKQNPHVVDNDDVIAAVPVNWPPHAVFVSEPGLYALIRRSKTTVKAEKFSEWIVEDVLPSLRLSGNRQVLITNGGSAPPPTDDAPSRLEFALLKKDMELQKLKYEIRSISRDREHVLQLNHMEKRALIHEKERLEMHLRYTFQTEKANQMRQAAMWEMIRSEMNTTAQMRRVCDERRQTGVKPSPPSASHERTTFRNMAAAGAASADGDGDEVPAAVAAAAATTDQPSTPFCDPLYAVVRRSQPPQTTTPPPATLTSTTPPQSQASVSAAASAAAETSSSSSSSSATNVSTTI